MTTAGVALGWGRWGALALVGAVLGALPQVASSYVLFLVYLISINISLAQSWNLIGGYTGLVSLGHAAFFGIGAYTTALLIRGMGTPFLLAVVGGGLVAAGFAATVSLPIFRFRGIYFTIGTLVLAEALRIWMINWEWTGGAQGLNLPASSIPPLRTFYYIALALAAGSTLLIGAILRNRLGLALRATRDNEDAAQNMGINTFRTKLAAFALSAFLAGLSGGIHAVKLSVIEPYSIFAANWTIATINIVIIGGIGTLMGPVLGAVVLTFLAEILANLYAVHLIITGLIFILVIRFLPAGLWGSLCRAPFVARLGGRVALRYSERGLRPRKLRGAGVVWRAAAEGEATNTIERVSVSEPQPGSPRGNQMALLELRHVTKSFGAVTAVQDFSFTLDDGQVLGIMGPNGAGKTTLLNLIMGADAVDRGEIRLSGERLNGLGTSMISQRGISRTYQIPQPFRQMTVLEHVLIGELYGKKQQSMAQARAEALRVLTRVGLEQRTQVPAGQLGLLELKRLELARALAMRPRVLLLDEIAAGLVDSEVAELRQILADLKRAGQTMVIIEHVLNLLFDLSDRILVMNFGERLTEGTPGDVIRDPRVIEAYLGSQEAAAHAALPGKLSNGRKKLASMEGVSAAYGDFQALSDVSLDIYDGEIVALVGLNGAGKSTLIRALTRQLPLTGGDIVFRGTSIAHIPPHEVAELGIAQCIEGRKIFPEMTVRENLELGAYCPRARARRHETLKRVYELFPLLAERERELGSSLSGGQQQMLAIGRALMAVPDLIIFDEISLGLAPLVIGELYRAVVEINRRGTTVLLVEQNVHRSLDTAHRAYVIEHGRIVLSGTADELSANQRFRETYFGL